MFNCDSGDKCIDIYVRKMNVWRTLMKEIREGAG